MSCIAIVIDSSRTNKGSLGTEEALIMASIKTSCSCMGLDMDWFKDWLCTMGKFEVFLASIPKAFPIAIQFTQTVEHLMGKIIGCSPIQL